jgi:hypothetical protein
VPAANLGGAWLPWVEEGSEGVALLLVERWPLMDCRCEESHQVRVAECLAKRCGVCVVVGARCGLGGQRRGVAAAPVTVQVCRRTRRLAARITGLQTARD